MKWFGLANQQFDCGSSIAAQLPDASDIIFAKAKTFQLRGIAMTIRKFFFLVLLCTFFYACAGLQTDSDDNRSASDDSKNISSDAAAVKTKPSGKQTPSNVNKDPQLSSTFVPVLYITQDVKLRKDPSLSGKVITGLKKGETVDKLDAVKDWVKVKSSSGKTGWVYDKYVSENK